MAALAAELARHWQMVLRHLERAGSVDAAAGLPEAALVALSLDHAYQAFETLLVRIERALGLSERSGAEWHRQILADAAWPIDGLRDRIVTSESERDWDQLRRFRHFLRHAYTAELDPERLAGNVARLTRAVAADEPAIRALIAALRA
jgi:hypothetical protein